MEDSVAMGNSEIVDLLSHEVGVDTVGWLHKFLETSFSQPEFDDELFTLRLKLGDWLDKDVLEIVDTQHKFFTPPHIARLIVDILALEPGEKIFDPCCGSGGLLTAVAKHFSRQVEVGQPPQSTFFANADNNWMKTATTLSLRRFKAKLAEPTHHKYDVILTDLFFKRNASLSDPPYLFRELVQIHDLLERGGRLGVLLPTEDWGCETQLFCEKNGEIIARQDLNLEQRGKNLKATILVLKKHDFRTEWKSCRESTEKRKRLWEKFKLVCFQKNGTEFQKWFADIMQAPENSDFIPTRSHGSEGDLKCDGYSSDLKKVYQCYAPESSNLKNILSKVRDDFKAAKKEWAPYWKYWIFVYNHPNGIPSQVVRELEKIQAENSEIEIKKFGGGDLWNVLQDLPDYKLESLLGI